ncbi:hypothetical protein FPQ18DRAFT_322231 [Pyronema domesticum]|uniref:Uncharacterized protein n=1 Tax=Pyronema omphalodes (strain CBS 100304) TaxID=1076935 RepID=U4L685_PYROM|nr:hypothetical protein FPQ18DRAFT_322231 [Pyronema domesticum]CCX11985.1 Similar to conserved hypothetical protein [Coccidioides posadasii str. Silveira]; acc. no. EFW17693 [Pyronema omphalodes CBS 100304]
MATHKSQHPTAYDAHELPNAPSRPLPLLPEFANPDFSPTAKFNPKSITEEAKAKRNAPAKRKVSGPLLGFNFSGNTEDFEKPETEKCPVNKEVVMGLRYTVLGIRILQAFSNAGIFVAMVLLRGKDFNLEAGTGWICRAIPAVAMIHTTHSVFSHYGQHGLKVLHNTQFYYLFSSTLDVALTAFYAYISLLTYRQHIAATPTWTSIFSNALIESRLIWAIFLTLCISGGLMVITAAIGFYLVHQFRLLSELPPDHNPFLDPNDPTLKDTEKRWSTVTSEPYVSSSRPESYQPPKGAKYSYQTISADTMDFGESRRDSRRTEQLGGGYGQVAAQLTREPSPPAAQPSLKRGSRTMRPNSLVAGLDGHTIRSVKRNSFVDDGEGIGIAITSGDVYPQNHYEQRGVRGVEV